MDNRLTALLGIALLGSSIYAQAQDYDDIYYDGSESKKKTEKVMTTPVRSSTVSTTTISTTPRRYRIPVSTESSAARSDDEYNRRGAYSRDALTDTLSADSSYIHDNAFANTERIERFYNPSIITGSDDEELITLYYDTNPSVNIIVGNTYPSYTWGWDLWLGSYYYPWYSTWYGPSWSWGWGWGWHSPWYSAWYDPWFGPSWSWYSPWHYSWYSPWYGHHHHWDAPHWRPNHYYSGNGRRPGSSSFGRSTNIGSGRRPGYASNSSGSASRRPASTGGYYGGGHSYGSTNVSGGRPGYATGRTSTSTGNVSSNSGRRPSSSVSSGTSSYGRNNSYSTGQASRSTSSYGNRSTTRSSDRSSSSSSWGSGRSSGSYSGGSHSSGGRSGGGFSGGGGRRR